MSNWLELIQEAGRTFEFKILTPEQSLEFQCRTKNAAGDEDLRQTSNHVKRADEITQIKI